MDFGDNYLSSSDPGSPYPQPPQLGIEFEAQNVQDSGFNGAFNWVQVYAPNQAFYGANGNLLGTVDGAGLDTGFPYGPDKALGDSPFRTDDNPATAPSAIPQNYGAAERIVVADHATMWLMYKPAASGAIWIPIDLVNWNWGGTDLYQAGPGTWQIANTSSAQNPSGASTHTYPVWGSLANKSFMPAP